MNRLIILFSLFFFIVSCTNNSTSEPTQVNDEKRHELELKEKELELKEKELQLKEKEMTNVPSSNSVSEFDSKSKLNKETSSFFGEGDFIPINESNKKTASFVLRYSFPIAANRPELEVKFYDDVQLYFNAVCEGDYFWCVKNENMDDIGYMKLSFDQNGEIANIKIKRNALSDRYRKYLDMLTGKLHRK